MMKSSICGWRRARLIGVLLLYTANPAWAEPSSGSLPEPGSKPATAGATPKPAAVGASPQAVARADELFREAMRMMDAGQYETAYPLLEKSQALDPSSATLLNLGECYERLGRTASARRTFLAARDLAIHTGRTDGAHVADARVKLLGPQLRYLRLIPPVSAGPNLAVELDGELLADVPWNRPVPVDPGAHRVRAMTPGGLEYVAQTEAPKPGSVTEVRFPETPVRKPSVASAEGGKEAAVDDAGAKLERQRTSAIVCGVLGVVGIAAGTVFGVRSWSKHNESDDHCPGGKCSQLGVDRMQEARTAGNVSTASFVAGGVALATAAVLLLTLPTENRGAPRAQLGFGAGTLLVRGEW